MGSFLIKGHTFYWKAPFHWKTLRFRGVSDGKGLQMQGFEYLVLGGSLLLTLAFLLKDTPLIGKPPFIGNPLFTGSLNDSKFRGRNKLK